MGISYSIKVYMKFAQVLCNCGKQVAYFNDFAFEAFQNKEFELLTAQGYSVNIGENLVPVEPCLEPCTDKKECAFAKRFNTTPGFNSIYSYNTKDCSSTPH